MSFETLKTWLLGGLCLVLAFWAGTQKNPVFGLFGFLAFFVTGVTVLVEGLRKKPASPFKDPAQTMAFQAGLAMMKEMEAGYRHHVSENNAEASPYGIFKARLFALNFAISAMTLALGPKGHEKAQEVYRALVREAADGLGLEASSLGGISSEILQEQSRALRAELNNVGSGQYALAALYEAALEESLGRAKAGGHSLLGQRVGRSLADWSELYRKLADRPSQGYAEGFSKSEKDFQGLPEE